MRKCHKNERKFFSQGTRENVSNSKVGKKRDLHSEVTQRVREGGIESTRQRSRRSLFVISELNVDLVILICALTTNHPLLISLLPRLIPYIFSSFHLFLVSSFHPMISLFFPFASIFPFLHLSYLSSFHPSLFSIHFLSSVPPGSTFGLPPSSRKPVGLF